MPLFPASIVFIFCACPMPLSSQQARSTAGSFDKGAQLSACLDPVVLVAGVRNIYQLHNGTFDIVYRAAKEQHVNGIGGDQNGNWFASVLDTRTFFYATDIVSNGVAIAHLDRRVVDLDVDALGRVIYATDREVWLMDGSTPVLLYAYPGYRHEINAIAQDSSGSLYLALNCAFQCSSRLLLRIPALQLKEPVRPATPQVLFMGTDFMTDVDVASDDDVYFASWNKAYRIPASGGPAQLLFTAPPLMFFEGIAADCLGGYYALLACDDGSPQACSGLIVHDGVVISGAPGISEDHNADWSDLDLAPRKVVSSSGPHLAPR